MRLLFFHLSTTDLLIEVFRSALSFLKKEQLEAAYSVVAYNFSGL